MTVPDTTTLYGIKNCDTVKKARQWLDAHGIDYRFHDLREEGLNTTDMQRWVNALGWEGLLNRRSTSWRQVEDKDKLDLDVNKAITLMLGNPTLIKRPVLEREGNLHVGFKNAEYEQLFNRQKI